MTVPARLDEFLLPRLRPSNRSESSATDRSPAAQETTEQFLLGAWLAITALTGAALVLVALAFPSRWVGVLCALTTAVPGSMTILRGVVDAVSPRGRLPKYTTSTVAWLLCYLVAACGLLAAFVA